MLRRSLLTGLIALVPTTAFSRAFIKDTECTRFIPCIEKGNTVYTYNKIGIPVSYSKELAADLQSIIGVDVNKILHNMYGTEFYISKKIIRYKTDSWIKYSRISNDTRDKTLQWYVKV